MGASHAGVHHVRKFNGRAFPRVDGRRTDDGSGRSAPFDHFDLGFVYHCQRLIPDILETKDTADRFP